MAYKKTGVETGELKLYFPFLKSLMTAFIL